MRLKLVFKILNNQLCPTQLHNYMTLRSECRGRILGDRREIHLPEVKSTIGHNSQEQRIGTSYLMNYGLMA